MIKARASPSSAREQRRISGIGEVPVPASRHARQRLAACAGMVPAHRRWCWGRSDFFAGVGSFAIIRPPSFSISAVGTGNLRPLFCHRWSSGVEATVGWGTPHDIDIIEQIAIFVFATSRRTATRVQEIVNRQIFSLSHPPPLKSAPSPYRVYRHLSLYCAELLHLQSACLRMPRKLIPASRRYARRSKRLTIQVAWATETLRFGENGGETGMSLLLATYNFGFPHVRLLPGSQKNKFSDPRDPGLCGGELPYGPRYPARARRGTPQPRPLVPDISKMYFMSFSPSVLIFLLLGMGLKHPSDAKLVVVSPKGILPKRIAGAWEDSR